MKALFYSHIKPPVKVSECCREVLGKFLLKSMKYQVKAISTKIERKNYGGIFSEIFGKFHAGSR